MNFCVTGKGSVDNLLLYSVLLRLQADVECSVWKTYKEKGRQAVVSQRTLKEKVQR